MHKNAIKPELTVRELELTDRPKIEKLVYTLKRKQGLIEMAFQCIYNPYSNFKTYVMLNKTIIVAFAVLS